MWTLLPLLLGTSVAAQDTETHSLFLTHCATCHGEEGDGKGVTVLPKPARSFLDGGFSYGNTRSAIGRTIEHGIPGTPMPSFAEALTNEQRAALVEYVIALGPERVEVVPADTVLEVTDRPRVVRGFLPSLAEGTPQWPRGLLVGLTSGTTFQYRADDVRLLAVRQGDFVERRDWSGRGGGALKPLGQVTQLVDGGNPSAPWTVDGRPLRARLTQTAIQGDQARVSYDLILDGRVAVKVTEIPSVTRTSAGAGFVREFRFEAVGNPVELALRWSAPIDREVQSDLYQNVVEGTARFEWLFTYVEDSERTGPTDPSRGRVQLVAIVTPDLEPDSEVHVDSLKVNLEPGDPASVRVHQITLVDRDSKNLFLQEVDL